MKFDPKANVLAVDYWDKQMYPEKRETRFIKDCIKSIEKLYPDFRFILAADYSEKSGLNQLKDVKNLQILYIPELGNYPHAMKKDFGWGHDVGLDEGIKHVESEYFFVVDWHAVMKKKGWPEKIVSYLTDEICAAGPGLVVESLKGWSGWKEKEHITPFFSVYKTDIVKRFHLSFLQSCFSMLAFPTGKLICMQLLSLGLKYEAIPLDYMREFFK